MTDNAIQRLSPALDRLAEAHFFLHGLETYYHFSNPFRWHINAFIRPIREFAGLVSMGLQNEPGFPDWFRPRRDELNAEPLIQVLAEHRDYVVHRGMLVPRSKCALGVADARAMRLGMGIAIDPLTDSDTAMRTYLAGKDVLDLLKDDEDSLPAVQRNWALEEFGDQNIVDLCAAAWLKTAKLANDVASYLGDSESVPDLDCRLDLNGIRIRVYDREDLRQGRVVGRSLHETRRKAPKSR